MVQRNSGLKWQNISGQAYEMLKDTVSGFLEDEALSHGAAIAFYTVTSMAPLLLVVSAVVGIAFGDDAARGAIVRQLSGLTGPESANFFQTVIASASAKSSGILASIIGTLTLLVTISGVFGEMQSALNSIWRVKPVGTTVSRVIRARAASFGLVVALGFLLMTSLAVSAALAALGDYMKVYWPNYQLGLEVLNFSFSLTLIAVLFGAIFKVLPDRTLQWKDVVIGAIASSVLFSFGKYLIAAYLASSGIATTYGAAGALILLLLWVYYSVQIFLLGAEFTKAYAHRFGSRKGKSMPKVESIGPSPLPSIFASKPYDSQKAGFVEFQLTQQGQVIYRRKFASHDGWLFPAMTGLALADFVLNHPDISFTDDTVMLKWVELQINPK